MQPATVVPSARSECNNANIPLVAGFVNATVLLLGVRLLHKEPCNQLCNNCCKYSKCNKRKVSVMNATSYVHAISAATTVNVTFVAKPTQIDSLHSRIYGLNIFINIKKI